MIIWHCIYCEHGVTNNQEWVDKAWSTWTLGVLDAFCTLSVSVYHRGKKQKATKTIFRIGLNWVWQVNGEWCTNGRDEQLTEWMQMGGLYTANVKWCI